MRKVSKQCLELAGLCVWQDVPSCYPSRQLTATGQWMSPTGTHPYRKEPDDCQVWSVACRTRSRGLELVGLPASSAP